MATIRPIVLLFFVLAALTGSSSGSSSSGSSSSSSSAAPREFMNGISGCGNDADTMRLLHAAHVTHVRRYAMWSFIEPTISSVNFTVTVQDLQQNPDGLIYQWAEGLNWKLLDDYMETLLAIGIIPVPELTEGTVYGQPKYNGALFDPSTVGIPTYLAYQYRWTRACVHRFKTKYPNITLYQIENELNEAFLEGLAGQRTISFIWANWTFLTEYLGVLRAAVKDEDPHALVTMNFQTDAPESLHAMLNLPGYYVDAIANWSSLLDVISIDSYPNMFIATPIRADVVGEHVRKSREASGGMEVFVMETGYPVLADGQTTFPNGSSLPPELLFSEHQQAAYVEGVVQAVKDNGGSGLFYFKFGPTNGMSAPTGGYTVLDESMFIEIREFLTTQNTTQLIDWALGDKGANLVELLSRAFFFATRADHEGGWGLLGPDYHPRLGYDAIQRAFANRTQ
jgi:hypothetical protein